MAIKPLVLPRPWAVNATYATGPFVGFANKADPGVGIAAEGHRPGAANPTAAEHENWQQNLITGSWVPWVNSGTSLGAASASIIERDILGKFAVTGFDVLGLVNATAITIAGPNGFAPLVTATSTGGGTIFQATQTGASTSYVVNMSGASTGSGVEATATATSTGSCFKSVVPAGSTSAGVQIVHNSLASYGLKVDATATPGTLAAFIETSGGVALRLRDSGSGTPFAIDPILTAPPTNGAIWSGTATQDLHFRDALGVERRCWDSVNGMGPGSQTNTFTAATLTGITAATTIQTVNYTFVTGARYWIEMSCMVGRSTAATTANATFTASVNGAALAFSPVTHTLFQGAASQVESYFHHRLIFTAATTGSQAVQIQVTRSDATATISVSRRTINIEGHYD